MKGDNITKLTIDWREISGDAEVRTIQYSTIDVEGILASFTTSYEQRGPDKPKISRSRQTLQIYSAQQLREMLERRGFEVLRQSGIDGVRFSEHRTAQILTVAKRR